MSTNRPHVLIAGGGIAGVETLLALRELAGGRLTIDLVAPDPDLVMRPLAVAAPFGTADVKRFPLVEICRDQGAHHRRDAVTFVDAAHRRVETTRGTPIDYDVLVLAVGARARAVLPGALTFDGPGAVGAFRALLDEVADGHARSVAFAVPEGATWPLPLYELALMTSEALAGHGVHIYFVTPERRPLEAFGPQAGDLVERLFAERGIELHAHATPTRVTNRFLLTSAGAVRADRVVALPELEGTRVPGVPCDDRGFIPVDEHGAVRGTSGIYAAGDGTTTPMKQGGVAAQLADTVAEAIASSAGAPCEPTPFRPVLRAELLTGTLPWFLRKDQTSRSPLWWPPGKVAARYLAPYLADSVHARLSGDDELLDRPAPAATDDDELEAARDMALALADDAAAAGEDEQALRWLDAAETVAGVLPPDYVAKRRRLRDHSPGRPLIREPGGAWH